MTEQTTPQIVIVGCGRMGSAIMSGWLASTKDVARKLQADSFLVVNPGRERREAIQERYQVACVADVSEIPTAPDIVVLAVKPQIMREVLAQISRMSWSREALFISVAAGLSCDDLLSCLPEGARLVRTMPNTPLTVGAGTTAICSHPKTSPIDRDYVKELFDCLGSACIVPEEQVDIVSAVSGSGPAYVAAFVEYLAQAGAELGLQASLAHDLALQTLIGTARLLDMSKQSPAQVRSDVCSPGGSTLAGLQAMEDAGIAQAYSQGVQAAVQRNKELAQC